MHIKKRGNDQRPNLNVQQVNRIFIIRKLIILSLRKMSHHLKFVKLKIIYKKFCFVTSLLVATIIQIVTIVTMYRYNDPTVGQLFK